MVWASRARLVCSLAWSPPALAWAERPDRQAMVATCPREADCTAMALPMTGQRRASICNFDMAPPHGEAVGRAADVDMARRVAADAFFIKGHTALDWRRTESIACDRNWVE